MRQGRLDATAMGMSSEDTTAVFDRFLSDLSSGEINMVCPEGE